MGGFAVERPYRYGPWDIRFGRCSLSCDHRGSRWVAFYPSDADDDDVCTMRAVYRDQAALKLIRENYRKATGLHRFGTKGSDERRDFLLFVAGCLNLQPDLFRGINPDLAPEVSR